MDFIERDDEWKHDANVAMRGGTKQRSQLRPEQLWLIQAHPDRAPTEEWIRLARESADGQLVATDIEGTNHDRLAAERFDNALVRAILFVLVRHRRTPEDEEFRAHQPNALGAARRREVGLLGQVDVGPERDANAIGRDRLE